MDPSVRIRLLPQTCPSFLVEGFPEPEQRFSHGLHQRITIISHVYDVQHQSMFLFK